MSVMRIRSNQDSRLPDPTMYRYKRTSVTKGFGNLKKENVNFLYLLNFRIGNLNTRKILLTKNNLVSFGTGKTKVSIRTLVHAYNKSVLWIRIRIGSVGIQELCRPGSVYQIRIRIHTCKYRIK